MAKRETKETYGQVKSDQSNTSSQYNKAGDANNSNLQDTSKASAASRDNATAAYNGFAENGGLNFTPHAVSPGSYNAQNVNANTDSLGGFQKLADDGGYDEARRNSIMGDVSALKALGVNGGLDDNAMARMRGNGVFDEFANTGGLNDADKGNIRAKALAPIGASNTAMNDELTRRRAVQGGYAPGFDDASRALRRDTARNAADTSLNTELGIKDAVNQGRMWGAGSLSSAEGNLQNLRTGNMLAGNQGAGNLETGLQESINRGTMGGLQGVLNNNQMKLSADTFNAGANNDASAFNTGAANQAAMYNADQDMRFGLANQQGREFGAQGAANMFSIDNANEQAARDRGLDILNSGSNANLGYYGARNPTATAPGIGGNIMNAVSAGAGVASNFFAPSGGTRRVAGKA